LRELALPAGCKPDGRCLIAALLGSIPSPVSTRRPFGREPGPGPAGVDATVAAG
jgi:hypothetical protein